jgi:hypothetical protein
MFQKLDLFQFQGEEVEDTQSAESVIKLPYDSRSGGQSVLVLGQHLGTATTYSLYPMVMLLRHLRLFIIERPI